MRSKPVLSHSPQLIPTLCAVAIAGVFPVYVTPVYAQDIVTPAQLPPIATSQPVSASAPALSESAKPVDAPEDARKEVPKPEVQPNTDSSCRPEVVPSGTAETPIVAQAEQIMGRPERFLELKSNVEITNKDLVFRSDFAKFRNVENDVFATGKPSIQRGASCYTGKDIQLKLDTGEGYVIEPKYTVARIQGDPAKGQADRIDFLSDEVSKVKNATYTTCQALDPDWYLKSSRLDLDTGFDRGIAWGSTVYFQHVPILYLPPFVPFTFPLSGSRQSGILPPTYGTTTRGGTELTIPYYWNIAPNRDLTYTARKIALRGMLNAAEVRYLGENHSGEFYGAYLANDNARRAINTAAKKADTASQPVNTNRYWLESSHRQILSKNADFSWNVKEASDNNYPADFFDTLPQVTQRLLPRDFDFRYRGEFWNVGVRASSFQVLQDSTDPAQRIQTPYQRLPQITFHAEKTQVLGLNLAVDSTLTRFWNPTLVSGDRATINPRVSMPFVRPGYFFTPSVQVNAASYSLTNFPKSTSANAAPPQTTYQSVVPTYSLGTGLVFERDTNLLGNELTQTLEPRLLYVKTPYRDQSKLPLFDTAEADFNLAQIFAENTESQQNRYAGLDRIGDANQLTAVLVSRFIEGNGGERIKFAVGQRFYFNTQQVGLDATSVPSSSDLLLASNGTIVHGLSFDVALQMSQTDQRTVSSNYALRWNPAPGSSFNIGYHSQKNGIEQVDFSAQTPLYKRFYASAVTNYSLRDRRVNVSTYGLEYRHDCWSFRLVQQRFDASLNNQPKRLFFQLVLNGLSSFGTKPKETL
jgi:LPS-assembly protein